MLSQTLFFTTLLATIVSASSAGYTLNIPKNVVQCSNATYTFTAPSTSAGPLTAYVFTGCNDANDDPIATVENISGTQFTLPVNAVSGATLFWQLVDAAGNDYYSEDYYVGGNSGKDATDCEAQLKKNNQLAISITLPGSADAASDATPTTASYDAVANAAETAGTTTTTGLLGAGGAISNESGAGKMIAAPSTALFLGLIGATILAL